MRQRIIGGLVALLAFLILVIIFLPAIISTGFMRSLVIAKVNEMALITVAIEDWRFHWFGSQAVQGLNLDLGAEQAKIRVERIELGSGLLSLFRAWNSFGAIRVESPKIMLPLLQVDGGKSTEGESQRGELAVNPGSVLGGSFLVDSPEIYGTVEIVDMQVEQVLSEGETEVLIDRGEFELVIGGNKEPVSLFLVLNTPGSSGSLSVKTKVGPIGDEGLQPLNVPLETILKIEDFDLAALSETLSIWAELPRAKGTLTGSVQITGSGVQGLHVVSRLRTDRLILSGGPLGDDHPDLGELLINVSADFETEGIELTELLLQCKQVQFTGSGGIGGEGKGFLALEGNVDLASLTQALPSTLRIRPGVRIDEGHVSLSTSVDGPIDALAFEGSVVLPRLVGIRDASVIAWDSPVECQVKGTCENEILNIERATFSSSFLQVKGSGGADRLTFDMTSDMGAAMREIGKFVDLGNWRVAGGLNLTAGITLLEQGYRDMQVELNVKQGQVKEGNTVLMPQSTTSVSLSCGIEQPESEAGVWSFRQGRLSWSSWISEGTSRWDVVSVQSRGEDRPAGWRITGLQTALGLDLESAMVLATQPASGGTSPSVEGRLQLVAMIDGSPEQVQIETLEVETDGLSITMGEDIINWPGIQFQTSGYVVLDPLVVVLPVSVLQALPGSITIRDVNARTKDHYYQFGPFSGEADIDFGSLQNLLGGMMPIGDEMAIQGVAQATFNGSFERGKLFSLTVDAGVDAFTFAKSGEILLDNEMARAVLGINYDIKSGDFRIENFDVQTAPIQLSAVGNTSGKEAHRRIDIRGELGLDLERAAVYLKSLTGVELIMEGKERRPFRLQSQWDSASRETLMSRADLDAKINIERIQGFGVDVRSIDLPVRVRQGVADLTFTATVNEGLLSVQPHLDFTMEQPELILINPTNLLHDLQLTESLANDLLALIHPMFKNVAGIGGAIDLGMESFSWPLDSSRRNEAVFSGTMVIRDLELGMSGFLNVVFLAAKMNDPWLSIGDKTIEFECRDGHVRCSPIRLEMGDYSVGISGTMGLDHTLDYYAEIPVTKQMVGGDLYEYLENATIRVPIRGTASNPDLSASVLQEAVADLVKQAAKNMLKKQVENKAGELLKGLFK